MGNQQGKSKQEIAADQRPVLAGHDSEMLRALGVRSQPAQPKPAKRVTKSPVSRPEIPDNSFDSERAGITWLVTIGNQTTVVRS